MRKEAWFAWSRAFNSFKEQGFELMQPEDTQGSQSQADTLFLKHSETYYSGWFTMVCFLGPKVFSLSH